MQRLEAVPSAELPAGIREQRRGVEPGRIAGHGFPQNAFRALEILAVDEHRTEIGQRDRVVRCERKRAREARFRIVVIARVVQADTAIDPYRGVGIAEAAQVVFAQCGGFGVAAQLAQQMREIAQRLPVTRGAGERRAVFGFRALRFARALERKAEIVAHARVFRRRDKCIFVRRDRLGVALLLPVEITEMEPCVGVPWLAIDRGVQCRLCGGGIALAQDDAEQGPRSNLPCIGGQRVATARFRASRVAALPCGTGVAKCDPRRILVDRAHWIRPQVSARRTRALPALSSPAR